MQHLYELQRSTGGQSVQSQPNSPVLKRAPLQRTGSGLLLDTVSHPNLFPPCLSQPSSPNLMRASALGLSVSTPSILPRDHQPVLGPHIPTNLSILPKAPRKRRRQNEIELLYPCTVDGCDRKYALENSLHQHIRNHHKLQTPPRSPSLHRSKQNGSPRLSAPPRLDREKSPLSSLNPGKGMHPHAGGFRITRTKSLDDTFTSLKHELSQLQEETGENVSSGGGMGGLMQMGRRDTDGIDGGTDDFPITQRLQRSAVSSSDLPTGGGRNPMQNYEFQMGSPFPEDALASVMLHETDLTPSAMSIYGGDSPTNMHRTYESERDSFMLSPAQPRNLQNRPAFHGSHQSYFGERREYFGERREMQPLDVFSSATSLGLEGGSMLDNFQVDENGLNFDEPELNRLMAELGLPMEERTRRMSDFNGMQSIENLVSELKAICTTKSGTGTGTGTSSS